MSTHNLGGKRRADGGLALMAVCRRISRAACIRQLLLAAGVLTSSLHAQSVNVQLLTGVGNQPAIQQSFSGYGSYSLTNPTPAIDTRASIQPGVVKISISATAGTGPTGVVEAQSSAQVGDSVTFNSPGLAGQLGSVTFAFFVPGSVATTLNGQADFEFSVSTGLMDKYSEKSITSQTGEFRIDTFPASRWINVTRSFQFGSPLPLTILASGRVSGVDGASASVDYGASVYFGGITEVRLLSSSATVENFTALGENGFDYRASYAPIPEPSIYAMFTGLMSLGVALWRRRAGRGMASA